MNLNDTQTSEYVINCDNLHVGESISTDIRSISRNENSCAEAFDMDTLIESTMNSVVSAYEAPTIISSVHDIECSSSPLLAHNSLINLGLRGSGMHIGHLNIRGIRSGEKVDQIKIMLQSRKNNICMLGISESKLGSDIPDSFCSIQNFQCFRKDKAQGSGGLLVYVRNDIKCIRRKDLEEEHFESMWFEVCPKNSKSFLVGHFYRNPLSNVSWNESFDDQIEMVMSEEKELFILGDINRDLLNSQIKHQWLDYMNSHGLTQHVNEPTRVVPNTSQTFN